MSEGQKPTHRLCVVEGEGEKAFWHRVGAGWPTKNPKVLAIQLPPGISVSGRLMLVEEGPEEEPEDTKGKYTKKK